MGLMYWFALLLVLVFGTLIFGNMMGWAPNDKRFGIVLWVLGLGFWGGILVWAWFDGGIESALRALGGIGILFGLVLLYGLTEHYGIKEGLIRLAAVAAVGVGVAAVFDVESVVGMGWMMLGYTVVWLMTLRGRSEARQRQ